LKHDFGSETNGVYPFWSGGGDVLEIKRIIYDMPAGSLAPG
jgi:hypothetical protein